MRCITWWGLGLLMVVGAGCSSTDAVGTASSPSVSSAASTSSPTSPPSPSSSVPVSSGGQAVDGDPWIVYQSPSGLRRVLPDGFNERALFTSPAMSTAQHPDFSRDGQWLAFSMQDDDGTFDLWTSGWEGSDPVRVVDCSAPCRDVDDPAWSPDGSTLAFYRVDNVDGHNPGSALQFLDVQSGEVTTVFRTEGAEYLWGPRWSPDGRSLVVGVTRYIDDGNDTEEVTGNGIGVIRLDAVPVTMEMIRPFESFASYPDWHPTEDLLLFEQGGRDPFDPQEPPQNVFTVRPDGTGEVQVTQQGPDDDTVWMATFRTDGEGILATRISRPDVELSLVSITMEGVLSEISPNTSPRPGGHPRQRMPAG